MPGQVLQPSPLPVLPAFGAQPRHQIFEFLDFALGQAIPFSEIRKKGRNRSIEIALDKPLNGGLEEIGRGCAGAVSIHAVDEAAAEMALAPEALHHREYCRAGKAARRAEVLDGLGNCCTPAVGNVAQQCELLLAYRCLSHGVFRLTTIVVSKRNLALTTAVVKPGSRHGRPASPGRRYALGSREGIVLFDVWR